MTGICYNSELTDPVTSFEELLTRPDLKGKIELLTEMRDTMVFMLLLDGRDPEKFTDGRVRRGDRPAAEATSTTARSGASPATTTSTT